METVIYDSSFFNIKDTLDCGQIFRYIPFEKGYKVFSLDKCCYAYTEEDKTVITCNDGDTDYFADFFDIGRDYKDIHDGAINSGVEILSTSAKLGKGIRILNQNKTETLFSFMISQNNNIPRIKGIIERLCVALGEKKFFDSEEYFAFPTPKKLSEQPLEFFTSVGLGYRARYIKNLAEEIVNGLDVLSFNSLSTNDLKSRLTAIFGVGRKVCDCVALFGYHRSDSFPVDTWIEKVYRQDFNGKLTDRQKISKWFMDKFGENAGYYQQYLFYFKRSLENK